MLLSRGGRPSFPQPVSTQQYCFIKPPLAPFQTYYKCPHLKACWEFQTLSLRKLTQKFPTQSCWLLDFVLFNFYHTLTYTLPLLTYSLTHCYTHTPYMYSFSYTHTLPYTLLHTVSYILPYTHSVLHIHSYTYSVIHTPLHMLARLNSLTHTHSLTYCLLHIRLNTFL